MNNLTFREYLIGQALNAMMSNTQSLKGAETAANDAKVDVADVISAVAIGQADSVIRVMKIVGATPSTNES